jgi:hypothetical protein
MNNLALTFKNQGRWMMDMEMRKEAENMKGLTTPQF